jgi:hypothetical protein
MPARPLPWALFVFSSVRASSVAVGSGVRVGTMSPRAGTTSSPVRSRWVCLPLGVSAGRDVPVRLAVGEGVGDSVESGPWLIQPVSRRSLTTNPANSTSRTPNYYQFFSPGEISSEITEFIPIGSLHPVVCASPTRRSRRPAACKKPSTASFAKYLSIGSPCTLQQLIQDCGSCLASHS